MTPVSCRWLLLGGAVGLEVAASLALKAALEAPALYAVVVAGYAAHRRRADHVAHAVPGEG